MNKEKSKILQHYKQCQIYHAEGERNTKGVTIIVKDEIVHKLEKTSKTGNYVMITFDHNNETHHLIGMYLEPEDYATATLKNIIKEVDNWIKGKENIIIVGDLNCIQNRQDAKTNTVQTTNLIKKYESLIKPLKTNHKLADIWREQTQTQKNSLTSAQPMPQG